MNRNRWIIFAALCVALLGFLVFSNGSSKVTFKGDPAEVQASDNVYGKRDSKVVFIEYGDFQCPGCGALFPVLKDVKGDYKDSVAFVYRYTPITTIHPNAQDAAQAAVAAANQGKFWEMHDLLYENQEEWSNLPKDQLKAFFGNYAQGLNLDMKKWRKDYSSDATKNRIELGAAAAQKAGLRLSTPTLIINGEQLNLSDIQTDGQFNAAKLRSVLNTKLQNAGIAPPQAADPTNNAKESTKAK